MEEMRESRVRANQIELQIREHRRDGQAIIFLHFSGANLMMWQRVVPAFQDQYRLVLVDLRGHGKSDRPDSGYDVDEMARDVIGIMQHLNLQRAHVVGSSVGAEVGLSMAASFPDRVASLTCDGALSSEYGPYGTWEGSEADFAAHVARELDKMRSAPDAVFSSVDALVARRRAGLEKWGWWNEAVEAMVRYGAHQVAEGQFAEAFSHRAMADYMQHYFSCRFEDYYRRVRCPVLMLPGGEQDEREQAAMEGLKDLARQAEVVCVTGWIHPYGWLLEPEGASQAVLSFLRRVRMSHG